MLVAKVDNVGIADRRDANPAGRENTKGTNPYTAFVVGGNKLTIEGDRAHDPGCLRCGRVKEIVLVPPKPRSLMQVWRLAGKRTDLDVGNRDAADGHTRSQADGEGCGGEYA